MSGGGTEFTRGFTLEPSTQGDIDYVEANFREGDRHEAEVACGGTAERTLLGEFERCWTARAGNGDVLGYCGVLPMPSESFMSRTRGVCFMSCANADRHRIAFVANSMPSLRLIAAACPPWVDTFRSWPLESYAASVRWQTRAMGFRRVGRTAVGDDAYIILETTRKEIFGWQ